jgi:hypothetical protein
MKRAISATLSPVRKIAEYKRPFAARTPRVPFPTLRASLSHRGREFDFVDRNHVAPGNVKKLSAMASAMKQSRKPDIP